MVIVYYATSSHLEATCTPDNIPIDKPLAIILGKEHEGISDVALKHCDGLVSIPMYGFTESFNVSVAASLADSNDSRTHSKE
jgi:tRNA (guanosine-2'-O-)-methyltransferase